MSRAEENNHNAECAAMFFVVVVVVAFLTRGQKSVAFLIGVISTDQLRFYCLPYLCSHLRETYTPAKS